MTGMQSVMIKIVLLKGFISKFGLIEVLMDLTFTFSQEFFLLCPCLHDFCMFDLILTMQSDSLYSNMVLQFHFSQPIWKWQINREYENS